MNVAAVVNLIVPPSFVIIPSASATAVVPVEAPPSIKFNSAAVEVTAVLPIVSPLAGTTIELPAKAVNVFAVNVKSSAPPILISTPYLLLENLILTGGLLKKLKLIMILDGCKNKRKNLTLL